MTNLESTQPLQQRSLADVVTENARAASVFERFGLDYCCHGDQTLEDAAAARRVPVGNVIEALQALPSPEASDRQRGDWTDLDSLVDHIIGRHHRYVSETVPAIAAWLDKLVSRHGQRHPELREVRQTFDALASELLNHMEKEENVLFPFIRELAAADRRGGRLPHNPFGTILHPVRVMKKEHRLAGELMAEIRALTHDYVPPIDACRTYQLCLAELNRFETDLHRHVYLEDHVLFPQAVELEAAMS